MLRKLWLSVVAATVGAALLVGASLAANAPTQEGSAEAKRGGTLRVNVSNTDFAFVDPALAYDTLSWGLLYTTNLTLLEPPVAGGKGTVYLRYGLAEGTPGTGDMAAPDRGAPGES